KAATLLSADRDVVQVRLVARQTARAGDRLVEGGVNPPVRLNLRQQTVAIRRPQLLDLAIAQQLVDDLVLALQLLQRRRVGREASLRLLLRLQSELVEQHRAQLFGRVDGKRVARAFLNLAF